jgi:hypothetical protein
MLLDVKWKCSDSDETHRVLVSYTQEFRSDSGYGAAEPVYDLSTKVHPPYV